MTIAAWHDDARQKPIAAWHDNASGQSSSSRSRRSQSSTCCSTPWFVLEHFQIPEDTIIGAFWTLIFEYRGVDGEIEGPADLDPSVEKYLYSKTGNDLHSRVRFHQLHSAVQTFDKYFEIKRSSNPVNSLWRSAARDTGFPEPPDGTDWVPESLPHVRFESKGVLGHFSTKLTFAERLFFCLETPNLSSVLSSCVSFVVISAILTSAAGFILASMPSFFEFSEECREMRSKLSGPCHLLDSGCLALCEPKVLEGFQTMEFACVMIFTVELVVRLALLPFTRYNLLSESFIQRLITCGSIDDELNVERANIFRIPCKGFLAAMHYLKTPTALVDIVSVLPYWIESAIGQTQEGQSDGALTYLMALRLLRLLRIVRIFKLGKHAQSLVLTGRVFKRSTPAIAVLVYLVSMVLLIFGSLVWITERGQWLPSDHPTLLELEIEGREAFVRNSGQIRDHPVWEETPYTSIVHACWWVVQTITTVGYGDLFPVGPSGKISGALCAIIGIVVLAMPVGVVGNNFSEEADKLMEERQLRIDSRKLEDRLARARKLKATQSANVEESTPGRGAQSGNAEESAPGRVGSSPASNVAKVLVSETKLSSESGQVVVSETKLSSEAGQVPSLPSAARPRASSKGEVAARPSSASRAPVSSSRPSSSSSARRPSSSSARRPSSAKEIAKWRASSTAQMACLHTMAQWWLAVLSRPANPGGPPHFWLPQHKRRKAVARLQRFLCAPQLSGDQHGESPPDVPDNFQRDAAKLAESLRLWLLDQMSENWVGACDEAGVRRALQEQTLCLEVATALMCLFKTVVNIQPNDDALPLETETLC